MTPASLILLFVTIQRLAELVVARRNTNLLMEKGGVETGAGHYWAIVLLHTTWLTGLWYLAWNSPVYWPLVAIYGMLQLARVWILQTLGSRWTTRIITVPGETLVRRGPYRFLRHPNYAVVALELPLLPLVFGLSGYAAVFGALNIAVLAWRISVEQKALAKAN